MFECYNTEISVTQGNYINSILTLVFFCMTLSYCNTSCFVHTQETCLHGNTSQQIKYH